MRRMALGMLIATMVATPVFVGCGNDVGEGGVTGGDAVQWRLGQDAR